MTADQITSLISPYLSNITLAEGASLVRSEYKLGDALAAIYYFEFSDDEINFDIDQYQEDHISSDYYNHPGYLQWNHYLIFVRESGIIPLLQKNNIEANDIYTRKFIFSKEEIKKYFTYSLSNQKLETDIVSVWKEKLRAVDLDEVYSDAYYTDAIPRFLNNDVVKEEIAEQSISTSTQDNLEINTISRITLRSSYRTHPKPRRSFDFKKVNLIRGANGTGKTSLLTGIELIVAGKTIADPFHPEVGNCISANFNGDFALLDEYTPNDNAKYRKRDNFWFSSSYASGNELYRTFNRYNYFDSDAAYKLSFDNDNLHITKYLSAIALGPEFGRIQARMMGFDERLGKELRTREKLIEEHESRRDEAQQIINAIQIANDPKGLFEIFISYAAEIAWKSILVSKLEDDPAAFEQAYRQVLSQVSTLQEAMHAAKVSKLADIISGLEIAKQNTIRLSESKRLLNDAKQKTIESKTKVEQSEKEIEILTRTKIVFDNPDAFELPGIEIKLSELNLRIKAIETLPELYIAVSNSKLFESSETFAAAKQAAQVLKEDAAVKLQKAKEDSKNLRSTLDQLDTIVADIKSLGQRYLTLEISATSCPLCATSYSTENLSSRIKALNTNSSENQALKSLNELINGLEITLQNNQLNIDELKKVEDIVTMLLPADKYLNLTFSEIQTEITQAIESLRKDEQTRIELMRKKSNLNQIGLTLSELQNRKVEFAAAFPAIPFTFTSKVIFEEKMGSINLLESLKATYQNDKAEEVKALGEFNTLLTNLQIPVTETDPERYLRFNEERFSKVIELFSTVQEALTVGSDEGIFDIKEKLTRLYNLFEDYRKSYSEHTQIQLATLTIEKTSAEILSLSPVIEKIKTALTVLRQILTEDNQETVLGGFLKENEKDIEEIFLSLHTPKEFFKIEFDYTEKTVHLHKNGAREPVTLNKISTGQRSALALAIFLALHKKLTHGPKILLFDDPVTYTDDLNILSFLDYLRNLVIKEDRQLIFATANQKLAGLFEKKFAFLEDEFELIPLERLD